MNIDEKCFTPASEMQIWPKTTAHLREFFALRTLRRRRAAARAKWPMFMPDVAYRIEGLPQPNAATDGPGPRSPAIASSPASPLGPASRRGRLKPTDPNTNRRS